MQELIVKAKSLLESGQVARVLGWRKGENVWDVEPAYFETIESLDNFVYNGFSNSNCFLEVRIGTMQNQKSVGKNSQRFTKVEIKEYTFRNALRNSDGDAKNSLFS